MLLDVHMYIDMQGAQNTISMPIFIFAFAFAFAFYLNLFSSSSASLPSMVNT